MKCRRAPDLGTAHMKVEQVEKKFFQRSSWKKKKAYLFRFLSKCCLKMQYCVSVLPFSWGFFVRPFCPQGKDFIIIVTVPPKLPFRQLDQPSS